MTLPLKASPADLAARLPSGPPTEKWRNGQWFEHWFQHGTMLIEIYAPRDTDYQTPHDQDELYIVVSGTGIFDRAGERTPFAPGDALFVPAGKEHRFVEFTPDFLTWVVFWGPKGGEKE